MLHKYRFVNFILLFMQLLCNYCGEIEEIDTEMMLPRGSVSKPPSLANVDGSTDKLYAAEEWQNKSGQWHNPSTPSLVR